jgi:hypothetical protein
VLLARAHVGREGGASSADVAADLEAALAVIGETGARTFEPFVREELARLAGDAAALAAVQALFASIGAAGHARRLQAEVAAG